MVEFEEITRDEWGALESRARTDLWTPVSKIMFLYGTNSEPCINKEECIQLLRKLQIRDVFHRRMPDINYR